MKNILKRTLILITSPIWFSGLVLFVLGYYAVLTVACIPFYIFTGKDLFNEVKS